MRNMFLRYINKVVKTSVEQVLNAALRNTQHIEHRLNKIEDMVSELDKIKADK